MSTRKRLTLCDSFATVANQKGDRPALVHARKTITYCELYEAVQALAIPIRWSQIARGERIAIIANKTPQTVITLLAALHTSAVLVIINPLLKREQVKYILEDSGATTLFCQSDKVFKWFDSTSMPITLRRVVVMPDSGVTSQTPGSELNTADQYTSSPFRRVSFLSWAELMQTNWLTSEYKSSRLPAADDLAVILYTSGSTGRPKGVMLSHSNLWHGADSVTTYLQNSPEDRILGLMPLSFDYGLSQLTSAIHLGACLVLHDYVLPKAVVQIVIEEEITGLPAVPHIWDKLTRIDWPAVPSLRYLTNTGGRLQLPTIDTLIKRFPDAQLYSMYGFTESFRGTYLSPEQLKKRPESIGKAVPHATVLVVDDYGRELPAGTTGELIQSGPLVSLGYWNDSEASSVKIRPRSIQHDPSQRRFAWSGDLAYTDEEGYIYFVSRKDDQVKLNGFRVSLAEIEKLLLTCPWISDVAVQCVADQYFGYVVVAFVVLSEPIRTDALTDWARQVLPTYMVPVKWFTLDALPMTPNNKIDRELLKSTGFGD